MKNRQIEIITLFSPLNSDATAAGGANIGRSAITLEIPNLKSKIWQLSHSLAILGHEIAHILWEERKPKKLISRALRKSKIPAKIKEFPASNFSFLNEIIIGSFLPLGYLGQKHFALHLLPLFKKSVKRGVIAARAFQNNAKNISFRDLVAYFIRELYPIAEIYGRQKKGVDKKYIEYAAEILRGLIKT